MRPRVHNFDNTRLIHYSLQIKNLNTSQEPALRKGHQMYSYELDLKTKMALNTLTQTATSI